MFKAQYGFLSLFVGLSLHCAVSVTPADPLIPLKVLFGNPNKMNPRIAPNGDRLAYCAPLDGVLNIWVKTVGVQDDKPMTHDTKRGIFTRAYDIGIFFICRMKTATRILIFMHWILTRMSFAI